jgi:hypothetical protein
MEKMTTSLFSNWKTFAARIVVLGWAGCWVLFMAVYLFSAIGKPIGPDGLKGFAVIALGMAIVIVPTWLAWRKVKAAGIVLVAEGLVIFVAYLIWPPGRVSTADSYLTALMLGGPPLVAGTLFLASRLNTSHN